MSIKFWFIQNSGIIIRKPESDPIRIKLSIFRKMNAFIPLLKVFVNTETDLDFSN